MLEDLGAAGGQQGGLVQRMPASNGAMAPYGGGMTNMSQQQFSSSSMQQSYSYSSSSSSQQQQQNQVRMQTSSSAQHQSMVSNGGRTASNNYSMNKSASASSMKNNADDVLKDLETGLKKSTNYIEESHRRYQGPEGNQEWKEVRRGGDPGADYSLEQQVQHMIGGIDGESQDRRQMQNSNFSSSSNQNYATANQLTTYKVQSNQYGSSGERIVAEDDDRPASRLKQNIDDLDTLLYDLNNARHLSPEAGGDYGNTGPNSGRSQNYGLDSDDYDETVGHEGHVKRTVQAFNQFSETSNTAVSSSKPPSPSPRRKTQPSPIMSRKAPSSPQPPRPSQGPYSYTAQSQQQSYRYETNTQQQMNTSEDRQEYMMSPPTQQVTYTPAAQEPPHQEPPQPSYYTKYNSNKPSSPLPTSVAFPNHQPRSQTPQMPPKRVEELMSEFHEFDTSHSGGSPTPPMFSKPKNTQFEVQEIPDGPPQQHVKLDPRPHVREVSPPAPAAPKSVNQKGPEVYYPPGSEFTKSVQATHPIADGGSMTLHEKGKGERKHRDRHQERNMEAGDKQGAAVIPICLPLCCAAPCVIM